MGMSVIKRRKKEVRESIRSWTWGSPIPAPSHQSKFTRHTWTRDIQAPIFLHFELRVLTLIYWYRSRHCSRRVWLGRLWLCYRACWAGVEMDWYCMPGLEEVEGTINTGNRVRTPEKKCWSHHISPVLSVLRNFRAQQPLPWLVNWQAIRERGEGRLIGPCAICPTTNMCLVSWDPLPFCLR